MDAQSARITAGELAIALSHYDIGEIVAVRRFRGGSRSSPKILLETRAGEYLFKRRPAGAASEPDKVAFTHEVMLHLGRNGFPVPRLIGTRSGNNSMLQVGPEVYEMFRYVRGRRFDRSVDDARASGWWLARCHALLADLKPRFPAPHRSFHAHPKVAERLAEIPGRLGDPAMRPVCRALADAYAHAAAQVERSAPSASQQAQIVHGDWHPGNLLYWPLGAAPTIGTIDVPPVVDRVAAVFDFDSSRLGMPLHDLANGAMQFAVSRHVGDLSGAAGANTATGGGEWKIALEPTLFEAFFAGYHGGRGKSDLSGDFVRAIPWLMIEALVVEAAVPIAQTGRFGKLAAAPVLGVVQRAVEAMGTGPGADRLAALAARPYH